MMKNLSEDLLPYSLLRQYVGKTGLNARQVIGSRIEDVLKDYAAASGII
jgi:tagatose-1,6-bisphosphate aldolase non-catalytic subunit AgaZ/GatZ